MALTKVHNRMITGALFDTVADMVASQLSAGAIVRTKGYFTAGDGGQADYLIQSAGASYDNYGSHQLANLNIATLQGSAEVIAEQFGAVYNKVGGSSAQLQAMLNWAADNNSPCALSAGLTYTIAKGLQLNARHNGLVFDCNDSFLELSGNTASAVCFSVINGYYSSATSENPGDYPIGDISLFFPSGLKLRSDVAIESQINSAMDATSLLPSNGGTRTDNHNAYTSIYAWVTSDQTRNTLGFRAGLNAVGGSLDYTVDLSTYELNIVFGGPLVVESFGGSGAILYNKGNFIVPYINSKNITFHPIGSWISSGYEEDANAVLDIQVGKIDAHNSGSCFDFSSEVKDATQSHGFVSVGTVKGSWIRGRTKVHGNYNTIKIDYLDQSMRAGGQDDFGSWPTLTILESRNLILGEMGSNTEQYEVGNTAALFVYTSANYPITAKIGLIQTDISTGCSVGWQTDSTSIVEIDSLYSYGDTNRVSVTSHNDLTINHVVVGKYGQDLQAVNAFSLIQGYKNLHIGTLTVHGLSYDSTTSPLIFNSIGEKLSIDTLDMRFASGATANAGTVVNSSGDGGDINIGTIRADSSFRTVVRGSGSGTALVMLNIKDSSITSTSLGNAESVAGSPIVSYQTRMLSAANQGSAGYCWWDSSAYRENKNRPTTLTDGTVITYV